MNYSLSSDLSLVTQRQRRAEDFPRYQSWGVTPPHSDLIYRSGHDIINDVRNLDHYTISMSQNSE